MCKLSTYLFRGIYRKTDSIWFHSVSQRIGRGFKLDCDLLLQSPSLHQPAPLSQLEHAGPLVYGFCSSKLPLSHTYRKVKVAHTRLPSVGFRSWSRFLAVSLQVTWVINPAAGCHYFPPGPQLPSQPLRGLLPVLPLGEQRHNGCEQCA